MDRAEIDTTIRRLIAPFNKQDVTITEDTRFVEDLEFDSLTVMDFVAEIEDEFDIIISMNPAGRNREIRAIGRRGAQVAGRMNSALRQRTDRVS